MNHLLLNQHCLNSTGLTQKHVLDAILEQKRVFSEKYDFINFVSAIVASIASAIAVVVHSVFMLIRSTHVPEFINGNLNTKNVRIIQNAKLFFISLLTMTFGCAVVGIMVGALMFAIGNKIIKRKIAHFVENENFLKQKFEVHGIIATKYIGNILKQASYEARKNLVKEMNFAQLQEAKSFLSAKEFKEFIDPVLKEAHENWRFILSLSQEVMPEKILNQLHLIRIQEIAKKNPFFVTAIQEELRKQKDERISSLLRRYQLPSIMEIGNGLDRRNNEISVKIEGHPPIVVDKDVLSENSFYFNRLFNPLSFFDRASDTPLVMALKEHGQVEIEVEEDYEKFNLFVNFLQGKISILDNDSFTKLWEMAEKYSSKLLLNSLSTFMIQHVEKYNKKDLLEMVEKELLLSQNLVHYIENILLSKKLTHNNIMHYCKIAARLNSPKLFNKCFSYAFSELEKILANRRPDISWATNLWKINHEFLKEAEYFAFKEYFVGKFSARNIKHFYEIAVGSHDHSFKADCIQYCQNNVKTLISRVSWSLRELPDEISAILYPQTREVEI